MPSHTVRVLCEARSQSRSVRDAATGEVPFFWRGSSVVMQLGLADNGAHLLRAGVGTIIVEVKPLGATSADDSLMRAEFVAADCDATFVAADWQGGSKQLLAAAFSLEDAAIAAGTYRLIVRHIAPDESEMTYLSAELRVLDPQSGSEGIDAPPVAWSYLEALPVVRTDIVQSLTEPQKTRARENIGADNVSADNVSVAAALMTASESSTTREGLRLADQEVADALTWQPYTTAKIIAGSAPIRVLVVGDSLAASLKAPHNMMPVGVIGLSRTNASVSVTDAGPGNIWLAPYHVIAAGGSAVYHQGNQGSATVVPIRADTRTVLYVAEPGAGSFDITLSTDGGATWGAATNINAANASQIGVASTAAISSSNSPRYLMRINNVVGGPVKIIAAGLYQSAGIGCIEMRGIANLSGIDVTSFGAVPDAIFNPMWTALAPDMVVSNFADAPEDWHEEKLGLQSVVTNGTTTITFAAYPPTQYDGGNSYRPFPKAGDYITGANIPAGTRIASHTKDSQTATLTNAATGSGTSTASILGAWTAFYDRCKSIVPGTDFVQLSMNPLFAPGISGHPRWISGTAYTAGQRVTMYSADGQTADEPGVYVCSSSHTAGAANKPESGGSWATFWEEDLFDSASVAAGTARARAQALAQRDWAMRSGESFVNGYGMFRDYATAVAAGMMEPDQIHPTATGHAFKQLVLWSKIPMASLFMGSIGSHNFVQSGSSQHVFGMTTNVHPSAAASSLLEAFRPLRISGPSAQLNLGDQSVPEVPSADIAFRNNSGTLTVFSGGSAQAIYGISSFNGIHPAANGRTLGGRGSFWWNLGGAGLRLEYAAKTANYTAAGSDYTIDVTANSPTITLPSAVALNATVTSFVNAGAGAMGKIYVIKNSGAGTVTIATTGGQLIDGGAPGTLAAGASIKVQSTGAGWITIP